MKNDNVVLLLHNDRVAGGSPNTPPNMTKGVKRLLLSNAVTDRVAV